MEQRQLRPRRIAAALPLDTQACYWRALSLCVALAGILVAALLGARLLTEQLRSTRAMSPFALYSKLNHPLERGVPGQPPKRSRTHRDPLKARPAQLLDLFNVPSSTAVAGGILATSIPLVLLAPQFYILGRLLHVSTRATGESSPNNPRAPPTP
jgi:hypothetical protein